MPSSKGSSQLRDQTHVSSVSCLAGATREAQRRVGGWRPESKGRRVWGHTRDSGFSRERWELRRVCDVSGFVFQKSCRVEAHCRGEAGWQATAKS